MTKFHNILKEEEEGRHHPLEGVGQWVVFQWRKEETEYFIRVQILLQLQLQLLHPQRVKMANRINIKAI